MYPTKQQSEKLASTLESCRVLYNCALEQRKTAYKQFGISVNYNSQSDELKEIKKYFSEYKQVYSQVLQNVLIRLNKAFKNFFNRLRKGEKPGYPRFKGKGWYNSFTYPQSGFSLSDNKKGYQRLKLSKIGNIKIKLHRCIKGTIKTCTIKKEVDKWYICFACKVKTEILPKTGKAVGIDVGLEKFATLSDSTIVENPRYLRKSEAKLKREQRKLSRKTKGSNSRKEQRTRVAKIHRKVKNQRNDFLHKESCKLVRKYDVIVFEDLRIETFA